MDISKFRTDPKSETEGVEIPVGEGFFITIARWGNKRAGKLYQRITDEPEVKKKIRDATDNDFYIERVLIPVMAEAILLGWRGCTDNGAEVPYSREKAEEFLKIKDFREFVDGQSKMQENFRLENMHKAGEVLKKT
jgi:hypothetical protein